MFIVVVMLGSFLLREFVDYRLFNILLYAFALLGTFEIVRAFEGKINLYLKCVVWAYALTLTPVATFLGENAAMILSFAVAVLTISALVVEFGHTTLENVGYGLFALFYPTGLLYAMIRINALADKGFIPLVLMFVTTMLADVGAYLVGSLIRGAKLSPEISPKKTISGFIGGLVFSAIGAVLVWLVFDAAKGALVSSSVEWLVYAAFGIACAVVSTFGDLVEGGVKRKLGIKDMGNLLPGHGGMLDRIDSTMFNAAFVCLIFTVVF